MDEFDREQFEELVNAGIEAIPKKFLDLLDNVAVTIDQEPTTIQLAKFKLQHNSTLLGLYEGVPQNRRGANYTAVLPDKITIFRGPILRIAQDPEAIIHRCVRATHRCMCADDPESLPRLARRQAICVQTFSQWHEQWTSLWTSSLCLAGQRNIKSGLSYPVLTFELQDIRESFL